MRVPEGHKRAFDGQRGGGLDGKSGVSALDGRSAGVKTEISVEKMKEALQRRWKLARTKLNPLTIPYLSGKETPMKCFRVILFALGGLILSLACAINAAQAQVVLLLSTDNSNADAAIKTTLEGFGYLVDIGPHYWTFDGSNLTGYDAVILLPSYNWTVGDMPVSGQTALKDFVSSGHGLVTGEWTVWKRGAQGAFATLYDAIPVVATPAYRSDAAITYTSVTPDDILNFGVDPSFTFTADDIAGTETKFVAKVGATTYYDSDYPGGAGVIGWTFGAGRVISFSTVMGPMEMGDTNYSQLLGNAITWSTTPPFVASSK
jgi:hypothetical protein